MAQEPCSSANTQMEINDCLARDFQAADQELNQTYQQLYGQLDSEGRARLKAAQRSWIGFRDNECRFEAGDYEGGSAYGGMYSSCQAALTRERTAALRKIADDQ